MLGEKEQQKQAVGAHANDVNKLIDWLIFFWKLRLDQGLIVCHVKWTLATPRRPKLEKGALLFYVYRQNCLKTTQKIVSNG